MRNPSVEIITEFGTISVELYADKAPLTVANFLTYIDKQLFDRCSFFRIVNQHNAEQPEDEFAAIQVVQGGLPPEHPDLLPPIAHESTEQSGILHLDGTISMARFAPGTADGSFFFCIGEQPELNFAGKRYPDGLGFAAFGRITAGREVLQHIYQQAEHTEYLSNPPVIFTIRRQ